MMNDQEISIDEKKGYVRYTVYSVQCTVYSVQCTVYSIGRERKRILLLVVLEMGLVGAYYYGSSRWYYTHTIHIPIRTYTCPFALYLNLDGPTDPNVFLSHGNFAFLPSILPSILPFLMEPPCSFLSSFLFSFLPSTLSFFSSCFLFLFSPGSGVWTNPSRTMW